MHKLKLDIKTSSVQRKLASITPEGTDGFLSSGSRASSSFSSSSSSICETFVGNCRFATAPEPTEKKIAPLFESPLIDKFKSPCGHLDDCRGLFLLYPGIKKIYNCEHKNDLVRLLRFFYRRCFISARNNKYILNY